MKFAVKDCCVFNGGKDAWAFEPLALQLSVALGIEIAEDPVVRRFPEGTPKSPWVAHGRGARGR